AIHHREAQSDVGARPNIDRSACSNGSEHFNLQQPNKSHPQSQSQAIHHRGAQSDVGARPNIDHYAHDNTVLQSDHCSSSDGNGVHSLNERPSGISFTDDSGAVNHATSLPPTSNSVNAGKKKLLKRKKDKKRC
ncbi:unnamed protein product, partial [Owenia fusiformis]